MTATGSKRKWHRFALGHDLALVSQLRLGTPGGAVVKRCAGGRKREAYLFWNQTCVWRSSMPSWVLMSLRRAAVGLRSMANMPSRAASCSGVTRERLRFSLTGLEAGSAWSSVRMLELVRLGEGAPSGEADADAVLLRRLDTLPGR